MKTVGSRELKNRLGRYLGLIRRGETVVVTDRGKPVAYMIPITAEEKKGESLEEVLNRLADEGHLRLAKDPSQRRTFEPIVTRGKPASQIVIEDRE
jgi:prevent-host-death family protein